MPSILSVTFPEEAIPLMTARQTMIQATSRERVILMLSPPLSAMVLVVFRVWRYQKYVVAELLSHSGSTTEGGEREAEKMGVKMQQ